MSRIIFEAKKSKIICDKTVYAFQNSNNDELDITFNPP